MTTVTVQLRTGEVLRDLPLSDAGDIVSAGKGVIIETRTTTAPMVDVPSQAVLDVPPKIDATSTVAAPSAYKPIMNKARRIAKTGRAR